MLNSMRISFLLYSAAATACKYSIEKGESIAKWIQSAKWDSIAERLSETSMSLITQVMNAEKDGDCSWIVWYECDHVLESIRKIANRLN